ncbi:hypothetical protein [Bacillus thuringiensis]|uniref:hypothetical protein n=1 Tax=Bacillus thuringiensis TaxID=1428 RepID=UPI000B407A8F|nr:hypothetical protein [Bacillus thuringiensis]ARX69637.1 hypothetical protein BVH75_27995 [Bacillus thuringiensis]MEB9694094.1 hypothetical protein [Bacillus cereus]
MNELVIQTHNFEKAKKQLKEFSMTKPEELALNKVDVEGGLFNWFDHKVTGQELNDLTSQIQEYLIKFNTLNEEFIDEFGEVYNALEALDKEYIQGILISIKAAEKASSEAKDSQRDINKTVEVQKQTISILKKFKDKLDKYEHLENVDEVWKDTRRFEKELKSINKEVDSIKKTSDAQANTIFILNQFKEELSKYNHLTSVDQLWEDNQSFSRSIKSINTQIDDINNSIKLQGQAVAALNQFKEALNYKHLEDIDQLWEDSQKFKTEVKLLEEKVEGLENHLYVAKQQMNEDKTNYESQIDTLFKKTKFAYVLAGGSIGIVLIQFMLSILGIL